MNSFLRLTLAFPFLFVLISCDVDNPKFIGVENIKIQEINQEKISFLANFISYNPNKQKINVRKTKMDIYIDDKYYGEATLLEKYRMPKQDTANQQVPIEVILERGVLYDLIGKIRKKEVEIKLKGKLKSSYSGIPFSREIEERKKVNLSDLNLKIGDILGF